MTTPVRIPIAQIAVLLFALAWCSIVLVDSLEMRVPLRWYFGHLYPLLALGLSGSVGLTAAALVAVLLRFRRARPAVGLGRFLRGLLYALMFGAIAYIIRCPEFRVTLLQFMSSLALGLFALGVLLAPLLARLRWVRICDIVLMNVCVILLVSEAGLRLLSRVRPSTLLSRHDDAPEQVLDAHRYPAGFVRMGFPCNSDGYYDEEFTPRQEGQKLVVAIGDSFSSSVVPHFYHYTTVAERLLDCRIDNLGLSATGMQEYLYLLEQEALPLDPDVVVLSVFIGNDINEIQAPRETKLLRSWFERDSLLLYQVPRRLRILREEARNEADHVLNEMQEPQIVSRAEAEIQRRFPWVVDDSLESPSFSINFYLKLERRRAEAICRPGAGRYEVFFQQLDQIARAAQDTKLVVMLIPDEFQVEDTLWQEVVGTSKYARELRRDQPQEKLRAWLEQRNMNYLDLLPELRAQSAASEGPRRCYKLRDTHLNVLGNRVAGEALANRLRPLLND